MKLQGKSIFIWILSILFPLTVITEIHAQQDNPGLIRALHMGGNWGESRRRGIADQPEEYYEWLQTLNINWINFVIGVRVENSLDDTVESDFTEELNVPTFHEEPFRDVIRGFKAHNIKVAVTMAIDAHEAASAQFPIPQRVLLGDPYAYNDFPEILPENWPWDPAHPNHDAFVASFWNSYTSEVKYWAQVAEEEGADMFAIGAESDRLFRSRAGGTFPNHFLTEMQALVAEVRSVFSGILTYEQHWGVYDWPDYYSHGSDHLFQDLGLDAVGVSAYFKLADPAPTEVLTVEELAASWRTVFDNMLVPLQTRNPELPVYFLEFGYVDVTGSPFFADQDSFLEKTFKDNDTNGLDDGEEQQANIHEAFYSVNEEYNRLVQGTFLFNSDIASNENWANGFGLLRCHSIRNKLAEDIVKNWYTLYTPLPLVPVLATPENGAQNVPVENIILSWENAGDASSYNVRLSTLADFSTLEFEVLELNQTEFYVANPLNPNTTYYWNVQSKNITGESDWADPFSFTTADATGIHSVDNLPKEFLLRQNYPNPFNTTTIISYEIPYRSNVKLIVHNLFGEIIATLVNEQQSQGQYYVGFDAGSITSGVYFYTLTAGNFSNTVK